MMTNVENNDKCSREDGYTWAGPRAMGYVGDATSSFDWADARCMEHACVANRPLYR